MQDDRRRLLAANNLFKRRLTTLMRKHLKCPEMYNYRGPLSPFNAKSCRKYREAAAAHLLAEMWNGETYVDEYGAERVFELAAEDSADGLAHVVRGDA